MNKILCMGALLSLGLLTACATQSTIEPVVQEPEVAPVSESTPVEMPQTTEMPRTLPAVKPPAAVNIATDSLTNLARAQYQARQYQSAIATAERGLRIDRRAASLYLLLAQSYMQLDMPQKAMNFVQQGLRYTIPESDTEFGLLRLKEILQE
jgi:tetratricopeptide (TPR) repeat protein